jgi:hypothetical protein
MFPVTWDPTQVAKKKRKTFLEQTEEAAEAALPPVQFQSNLHQTILRRLNNDVPYSGPSSELKLDHILSRVPYKSMLENLFQSAEEDGDEGERDVPILSRAYEESFMRQPMPGERACAMGELCECMFIDRACPFVAAELRLPNDPDTAQMCVLCSRATTQPSPLCVSIIVMCAKNGWPAARAFQSMPSKGSPARGAVVTKLWSSLPEPAGPLSFARGPLPLLLPAG